MELLPILRVKAPNQVKNDVCSVFKKLSIRTWNYLKKSKNSDYQLKEESITDMLVLEMKRLLKNRVQTITFDKQDEFKNGSDWEWWFHSGGKKWIGFRVQAKIMKYAKPTNKKNRFRSLHFKSKGSTTYQCDKLINDAMTMQPPRVPLYCLYVYPCPSSLFKTWNCRTYERRLNLLGCSLIDAHQVLRLRLSGGDSKNTLSDLENKMFPWSCLVCCSAGGGRDIIDKMENFLIRAMRNESYSIVSERPENAKSYVTDNPPSYVSRIMESDDNIDAETPDQNLYGVLVCDLSYNEAE